jgi:hypothetical protein
MRIEMKNSKFQAPSSKEAPSFKLQTGTRPRLELDVWNYSGAWMLELGVSFDGTQQ